MIHLILYLLIILVFFVIGCVLGWFFTGFFIWLFLRNNWLINIGLFVSPFLVPFITVAISDYLLLLDEREKIYQHAAILYTLTGATAGGVWKFVSYVSNL